MERRGEMMEFLRIWLAVIGVAACIVAAGVPGAVVGSLLAEDHPIVAAIFVVLYASLMVALLVYFVPRG